MKKKFLYNSFKLDEELRISGEFLDKDIMELKSNNKEYNYIKFDQSIKYHNPKILFEKGKNEQLKKKRYRCVRFIYSTLF